MRFLLTVLLVFSFSINTFAMSLQKETNSSPALSEYQMELLYELERSGFFEVEMTNNKHKNKVITLEGAERRCKGVTGQVRIENCLKRKLKYPRY